MRCVRIARSDTSRATWPPPHSCAGKVGRDVSDRPEVTAADQDNEMAQAVSAVVKLC